MSEASFCPIRLQEILERLAEMAAGNLDLKVPVSDRKDELDAIAFGINMLAGELRVNQARIQKASLAKSEFVAVLSHELRTPLTSILLCGQLLQGYGLDERSTPLVSRILRSARTLQQLAGDILDISKIEAGRLEVRSTEVVLMDLISEAIGAVEQAALQKALRLSFAVHSDLQLQVVETDPLRLKQILLNILSNAIRFTPAGGSVRLEVLPCRGEAESSRFAIEVVDSGVGIAKDAQEHLFQPYFQVKGQTQASDGTGLGLALSRQLAELLGGELRLEWSGPGKGSCFRLELPSRR